MKIPLPTLSWTFRERGHGYRQMWSPLVWDPDGGQPHFLVARQMLGRCGSAETLG